MPCGRDDVLDALLHPVQRLVHRAADDRGALQGVLAPVEEALVAAGRAQGGEVVGQAAGGRGVGALVVVDDDDQRQVLVGGDVVDRLPRHAAGERAVADDRDGVPVALAAQATRLGDAVGPGQRGRGVGVLDDVVLGLGAAGVAGQAALLREPAEVVPAGEQLVHVGLVAGVEDDRCRAASRTPGAARWSARPRRGWARGGRRSSRRSRRGRSRISSARAGSCSAGEGLEVVGTVDRVEHVHDQVVLPHRGVARVYVVSLSAQVLPGFPSGASGASAARAESHLTSERAGRIGPWTVIATCSGAARTVWDRPGDRLLPGRLLHDRAAGPRQPHRLRGGHGRVPAPPAAARQRPGHRRGPTWPSPACAPVTGGAWWRCAGWRPTRPAPPLRSCWPRPTSARWRPCR